MWKCAHLNKAAAALNASAQDFSMTAFAEILDRLPSARVLVVGDALTDNYVFGRVTRICPEAPVPVFVQERAESRPGGAANVVNQIAALGVDIIDRTSYSRGTKTRYLAGHHMLLRVDDDHHCTPTDQSVALTRSLVPECTAVVCSDYAKGWLTPELCVAVIDAAQDCNIPVIVDPKGADWRKYAGCSLICPNEAELPNATRFSESSFLDILVKRGPAGMRLLRAPRDFGRIPRQSIDIPATARRIYDVTGAGDTVVAVVAAAVSVGATFEDAARLAAIAAGYVVGEIGTTVCPLSKLKELIDVIPANT
jgi:D-beta-D-heptose 7-phosphate kinase / D-beta-D-heptose 1-phosphate adenosyltransferase